MGYLKPLAAGVLLLGSFASATQADEWKLPEAAPLAPMEEAPETVGDAIKNHIDALSQEIALEIESNLVETCYEMPLHTKERTVSMMIRNCTIEFIKVEYSI